MNVIMVKNFLQDFFRFMKAYPEAREDLWKEICEYARKIADKYQHHRVVEKLLLAYMDSLEEKQKIHTTSHKI